LRLVEGIDQAGVRPEAHAAIRARLLVNFNVSAPRNPVVPYKSLNSPHGAIREASLACNAFILICLHTDLLGGSGKGLSLIAEPSTAVWAPSHLPKVLPGVTPAPGSPKAVRSASTFASWT